MKLGGMQNCGVIRRNNTYTLIDGIRSTKSADISIFIIPDRCRRFLTSQCRMYDFYFDTKSTNKIEKMYFECKIMEKGNYVTLFS